MKRDLLTIRDLSAEDIIHLVSRAAEMKRELAEGVLSPSLAGKILGLLFIKPSTRTRVSFEAAMIRLGGQTVFMTAQDSQISRKEPLSDTARVLSRYVDGIVVRTHAHADVEELGRYASIPVINGLTDLSHPCQVLSDLLTIQEHFGNMNKVTVAWIGDGNNMAHSWINAAARIGFTLYLACPSGYPPNRDVLETAQSERAGKIFLVENPLDAVSSADVLYTDVWASMGYEDQTDVRRKVFSAYQVNEGAPCRGPVSCHRSSLPPRPSW